MDGDQALATVHVLAALSALVAGAAVLVRRKGTDVHRAIGTVYVVALILVNVAALPLQRESTFGVFHALAVASLGTIAAGLVPLLLGKASPRVLATHAYCMTWSYAGLVAAGAGQLAVAAGQDAHAWVVPVVIGAVLAVSGAGIFGAVPSILDRLLSGRTPV